MSLEGWTRLMDRKYEHVHLAVVLESYFGSFKALTASIREVEKKIAEREKSDERADRLKTIPGVGRIASMTFLAAVDEVERFPSARKLVGYSGLSPTVRSSGERTEYGSISREGRRELRAVWVQIAHLVANDRRPEAQSLVRWYKRVAKRRGKKTATVALARRLLEIAYHMLKEGSDYEPSRMARAA